ncbi:Ku protein [Streptomyces roseoverticillatus]|uniref:Ku protein n=1 Tax=Streptomyces roseoverticillatus TaxID=66429 RepID=UPI000694E1BB|nr:Ku protein [Streptomyces roseoverticillatus]
MRRNGGRIKHRRVCDIDHQEVPYEQVAHGVETLAGTVVLRDDDFARLPLPARKVLALAGFVPAGSVDPVLFHRSYYAEPHGPGADRAGALLATALTRSGLVGVGKIAVRMRERPAVLRPYAGFRLLVATLYWPHERNEPPEHHGPTVPPTDRELGMAEVLVEALAQDALPELHDEYVAVLERVVEAKAAGRQLQPLAESPQPVDLMAALEASIQAARRDEHP